MRHPICNRLVAIVYLDEQSLVGRLSVFEIPSMSRVWQHSVEFLLMAGIVDVSWNKIGFRHAVRVGHGQWVFVYGLQRPPNLKVHVSFSI